MSEVVTTVALLRAAWPRAEFPPDTQRLYAQRLADVPGEWLQQAVTTLAHTSVHLPTLAELFGTIAEQRLQLPDEDEAWVMVAGPPHARAVPVAVQEARAYLGGSHTIRTSDNQGMLRAQFRDAYRLARKRALDEEVRRVAGLPKLLPPAATPEPLPAAEAPVLVRDMNEPMAALPETTRVMPRPVLKRWVSRQRGHALPPPTEAEKADAIRVLEAGPTNGELDPLYREAEAIFHEAGQ